MDLGNNNSNYDQFHYNQHHSQQFVQQQNDGYDDTQLTLNQSSNNQMIQKEHMFDKVVTPSDVGKLNRLVIPKQHAEKYFPLDSSSNEKGLLLNFEDGMGKSWRFRYSYWNSSQSYVMTKGWSRFVKDKSLDAGDIVSFHRGAGDFFKDRLFIDWRRRVVNIVPPTEMSNSFSFHHHHLGQHHHNNYRPSSIPWNPMFLRPPPPPNNMQQGSIIYLRSAPPIMSTLHQQQQQQHDQAIVLTGRQQYDEEQRIRDHQAGMIHYDEDPTIIHHVLESIPIVQQAAGKQVSSRTLRLFGVDMECGVSSTSESAAAATSRQLYSDVVVPFQDDEFVKKGKSSLDFDI